MTNDESIINLLEKRETVLRGSFILTSGRISDTYIQLFNLLDHPEDLERICGMLADKISEYPCDVILAPAFGAIIIGYLVAKHLRLKHKKSPRYMFCERANGTFKLRPAFSINKNENVWIVENVITTGKSAYETIDLARQSGGNITGVATIVDRGGGKSFVEQGINFIPLVRVTTKEYDPAEAPRELLDMGPIKPGSSGKK